MIFEKDSIIVQAWVRQIISGIYEREDVPAISNLREVVYEILDKQDN